VKSLSALLALLFLSSPVSADPASDRLNSLVSESKTAWQAVNGYSAMFYKEEPEKGKMGPREKIFLKYDKPFKIYMLWLNTRKQGLQVLYERGKHDNKLAIHKPGLIFTPVIFLPQDSPWVREGSEAYDIEDAGIGTFVEDFAKMVERAVSEGKISAKVTESAEGALADVSFPGAAKDEDYFASRAEVLFDAVSKLPVKMKLYDFKGELSGTYEYDELKLNPAEDPEFKKLAHRAIYPLY
jgi:outer membrane lipoprotein-sorting protein